MQLGCFSNVKSVDTGRTINSRCEQRLEEIVDYACRQSWTLIIEVGGQSSGLQDLSVLDLKITIALSSKYMHNQNLSTSSY